MDDPRRNLPSVERVLSEIREATANGDGASRAPADAVRAVLADARAALATDGPAPSVEELAARVHTRMAVDARPSLRTVINATGVILQTNLGRAPLSDRAIAAMREVAAGYSNLEYDLESGGRGSRHTHLRDLIRRTTGADDGIVVNNNAAAILMALQVFASGREVIISRGQAVEIGGGFRIPDVLRQSGAVLREVGTTNRTYARDYAEAWNADSAAILRVHSSNFKVVGFTAEPSLAELAGVAHQNGGLLLDDIGSGCVVDTARFGIAHEPTVRESVSGGADLTMFSGDKLLGGPQAGIIVGRAELIARIRKNPLKRALRLDKVTLAALGAVLRLYLDPDRLVTRLPALRLLARPLAEIRAMAERLCPLLENRFQVSVVECESQIGSGAAPTQRIASAGLALRPGNARVAAQFRKLPTPVIGRVQDGAFILDLRCLEDEAGFVSQIGKL